MKADPHKPLREDVRLLGELLGDTLRAHGGEELFDTVERVRSLSKASRARETSVGADLSASATATADPPKRVREGGQVGPAFTELASLLAKLPVEAATPLARAFAHFLNLANVAEQHHRIRRRRAYLADPASRPQAGSCQETFERLAGAGIAPDALFDAICTLRIELVLTAHPTEVSRRTLIHKYNRIAQFLAERDHVDLTVPEREEVTAALRREIVSAWETDEVRHDRPSPLDEVRGGLIVFEESLWHAVPVFLRSVDAALRRVAGRGLPLEVAPLRFGSWIGGDRDGNPNVTPEVTRKACLLARWQAADLYLSEINSLRDELSMSHGSPELAAATGNAHEPYRALLRDVRTRLLATRDWVETALREDVPPPAEVYLEAESLAEPLRLCDRSLVVTGNEVIAGGRLADLLRRIATFGVTLARLDIRQESDRHTQALAAITVARGLGSYAEWDEPRRVEFLAGELRAERPVIPASFSRDESVAEVLDTFHMIARIPHESLGAYVITMTHQASDILAVQVLQRAAGRHRGVQGVDQQLASPTCPTKRGARSRKRRSREGGPPGSHARVLGLVERRRTPERRVGAVQGAGSHRRDLQAESRGRDVISRPRRQRRPRRRSHLSRASLAAERVDRRHHPRDGAGRDDPGALRASRHRDADHGGVHERHAGRVAHPCAGAT